MEEIRGYCEHIIFRNKENDYTVFVCVAGEEEEDEITCTGYTADIREGENYLLTGEYVNHPVYGEQFQMKTCQPVLPESGDALRRYLGSGAVKGIGETLAGRILKKFGEDTTRILDEEPERLSEVRGISERKAREIAAQLKDKKEVRDAMIFLQQYGISGRQALKIWQTYGMGMYGVLKENPYRLAEDISGIGFATADEIASRTGIRADSDFRIRSGLLYVLSLAQNEGSSYLTGDELRERTASLLGVEGEILEIQLQNLAMDRKVYIRTVSPVNPENDARRAADFHDQRTSAATETGVFRTSSGAVRGKPGDESLNRTGQETWNQPGGESQNQMDGEPWNRSGAEWNAIPYETKIAPPEIQVYPITAYRTEQQIARRLLELDSQTPGNADSTGLDQKIRELAKKEEIELDDLQAEAVREAVLHSVLLMTGGPGTGKTTTINTMIRYFVSEGMEVMLAAPTGRAAKRMTEATGFEARTLHRVLGVRPIADTADGKADDSGAGERLFTDFEKGEDDPLETDVIIIDEMSMVDMYLFLALLKAILPGTRLILVGDMNQLPSVGPGRVLQDLIESCAFHTIILRKIFRQAAQSDIVMNAHRILQGDPIRMDNHSRDFFFLERNQVPVIYKHMVQLLKDMLPGYVHCRPEEIQILTPMRKGSLGVEKLNEALQSVLNPSAPGKQEYKAHETIFREGDKVMQTRNNYQIEWEIEDRYGMAAEEGTGIFNGDTGIIEEIDPDQETMTICFDEERIVRYPFDKLEDLELAYAMTVHKSQGSEYPAVILPLLSGPSGLFNRNLLYTAVTRAKSCVVILGSARTVSEMIANVRENTRHTGLKDRILEMKGGFENNPDSSEIFTGADTGAYASGKPEKKTVENGGGNSGGSAVSKKVPTLRPAGQALRRAGLRGVHSGTDTHR